MFAHSREEWERTFNICWGGVYNCTRAFLPMLQKAEEGHIVNTSSVNGFWASIGPKIPHTAYSAAKFAVKGFTEALIADLRINAPHIKCSVVMPGHIGTSIPLEVAPTSAAEAAKIILDGVKAGRWRILVGEDAHEIDRRVRQSPEHAYDIDFFEEFARAAGWRIP